MDAPRADLDRLHSAASRPGFAMSCDHATGRLLATLAASKPGGRLLELGTGVGAGTCWIRHGMGPETRLITWPATHTAAVTELTRILFDCPDYLCIRTRDGSGLLIAVKEAV